MTDKKTICEMAKNADPFLVKWCDLGLFNKVKDFLDEKGLNYEIRGSAFGNALEGKPREYNDLDILVPYVNSDDFYRTYMGLIRSFNKVPECNEPIAKYVTNHSDFNGCYVNTRVNQRFTLEDGVTKIDLSFQSPVEGITDAFDRKVPSQYLVGHGMRDIDTYAK